MAIIYPNKIKQKARDLRNGGFSLGEISLRMTIPKNTLSGWVKDIHLTMEQKKRIERKIIQSGKIGRPKAIESQRQRMETWKENIRAKVKHFGRLPFNNPEVGKLICGLLYLCEGAKYPATRYLSFGNSDPKIIFSFLSLLRKHYSIDESKLRFNILHRWDQNIGELKNYWSELTEIPQSKCLKSIPDRRSKGKPTLKQDYKGVCRIVYYSTDLQFELLSIGEAIMSGAGEGT